MRVRNDILGLQRNTETLNTSSIYFKYDQYHNAIIMQLAIGSRIADK